MVFLAGGGDSILTLCAGGSLCEGGACNFLLCSGGGGVGGGVSGTI